MGNIFIKGTKIGSTALELLTRTVKAPGLFVHKIGRAEFVGAAGDTVNIKRPPLLRARDKGWRTANKIVVDKLAQSSIPVRLTAFPYSAVHLSPEEETLDDVDYVRDVQAPQVRAIAEFYEDLIVAGLSGATFALPSVVYKPASTSVKESDARKVASRGARLLTQAKVPNSGRMWLVGAAVAEAIRDTDKLLEVDTSGLPEALRDGVVTRLSGFLVVELDALAPEESYFVHETALAIANFAPVVPRGAVGGASITGAGGLAVTQVWDYDSEEARDRSIVMSFAGVAPVTDPKVLTADKPASAEAGTPAQRAGEIELDAAGNPVLQFVRAARVAFPVGD